MTVKITFHPPTHQPPSDQHEVHRDLKPGNNIPYPWSLSLLVLYSRKDSDWKLTDFGLTSEVSMSRSKRTSRSRGTAGYRGPELLKDENCIYNNKLAIWPIGYILYELVVGRKTFSSDFAVLCGTKLNVILDHKFDEGAAKCFSENIHRILEIDPSRRPSAPYLLEDFSQYCQPVACQSTTSLSDNTIRLESSGIGDIVPYSFGSKRFGSVGSWDRQESNRRSKITEQSADWKTYDHSVNFVDIWFHLIIDDNSHLPFSLLAANYLNPHDSGESANMAHKRTDCIHFPEDDERDIDKIYLRRPRPIRTDALREMSYKLWHHKELELLRTKSHTGLY